MCERTIAKYEEELSPTKYEKERQHQQLNAVFKKHQVVLHRTEEEEEPQLPHIKEEEEELCITQEGECLLGQEEADLSKFLLSVKTEEHEDKPPESSQLLHSPSCGPKEEFTSPWNRLCFDGDENNYGYWETKFLAYLHLLDLKSTILGEPPGKDDDSVEEDGNKNEEAYAVLIQLLDDKSLSLVMRDATDDGRKALQILRDHYAGKDKPCVVSLYTELTSLQKGVSESVADYIIRAETAITALRNAGQTLSDGLLAAVLLKGLPDVFKPFSVHVTQRDGNLTFAELKTKLRSYESAENVGAVDSGEDRRVKVEEEDHTLACKPGFEPQSLADGVTDSGTLNLNEALNVQSFSKDIFTVRAETAQEATVLFIEGQNCLTPKNDVQQLIGHQEKPPQLLEWSSTLKQEDPQPPHIKEEKEELWIPQEGECLLGQEEADPLTVVSVKTEDHEDKTPESSQLHHSPSEDKREAEPPSSSSTQHMTTEAEEDHCGGSQADKLLAPLSDSEDTTSHDNANMESYMRTNAGEKTFICSVCAKSFGENFKLIRHMRTHTGEKPFICSNCGKKFSRKETMLSHMKVHTGENLYSCPVCAKGFVRNSNLAQHMKTHTGERPFSCSLCNKSFAVKSKMQIHMRTHTGEKPFSCSECGNRFSNKSNMQIHMRTHTGETLFSCPLCDKRFSVKSNMQTHLRTHARQ